jgi:isocitrate dehydrogenase (NAD+)
MAHKVTYIPGDGIGPEVVDATIEVLDALGLPFEWERADMGAEVLAKTGSNLPTSTLEGIIRSAATLKGRRWPPAPAAPTWPCARPSTSTPTCGR